MLNISQRLIIGGICIAALAIALAVWVHRLQLAAGHVSALPTILALAIILILILTITFALRPINNLARDARRVAQGDLEHRIEWSSHDSLGVLATELNRLSIRLRELRNTEAGRRQMEFQLSDAVLQSIFEPIIVTDGKGHVLKLNQAAAEVLGEAAGDRLVLANTPGGDKILEAIRDAVSLQKAVAVEGDAAMLPMRVGASQRSFRLRTTPMRDSEGRLLGAVTTLEDVTSLEETDRFKSQFISVASRKLRDPLLRLRRSLYAIGRGYAGELKPLQTELLATSIQEADKLDYIMADLIEVSELDSGKREMALVKLRPLTELQAARDRFADEAAEKRVRIDVRAYADLSYIDADRRALRSVLDNLISNALRYTLSDGEILLMAEEHKDAVRFTVSDTGRGIEAERLSHIFDRFSSASEKGSGMGLALVRRIIEALGGQISAESRLGHGTTFHFTVPVSRVKEMEHPVEVG
jgi:signal transduction histidine kinase